MATAVVVVIVEAIVKWAWGCFLLVRFKYKRRSGGGGRTCVEVLTP